MATIIELMRHLKHKEGDVGVEIEVEGVGLPEQVQGWRVERDGSLRGENCEYVLPAPLTFNRVKTALKRLTVDMRTSGAQVLDTGYAGIHIHVNVQRMTPTQVVTYAFLYYALEDLCLEYCGEDRKGNLFCLPAHVAPYPLTALAEAFGVGDLRHLCQDKIRYASLNWKALSEYGSLEFRGMRSTLDEDVILKWIALLLELRETAIQIDSPQRVVEMFSEERGNFVKAVLPTQHQTLLDTYTGDVERAIERGVRVIQRTAYTVNWERFRKKEVKERGEDVAPRAPDPFERLLDARAVPFGEMAVEVARAGRVKLNVNHNNWAGDNPWLVDQPVRDEPEEDL